MNPELPWDLLNYAARRMKIQAANEVISQMAAAGLLRDDRFRNTEIPAKLTRVAPRQTNR